MELTNYSSRTAEVKAIIASFMADKEEPVERREIAEYVLDHVTTDVTDGVIAGAIKIMASSGEIYPVSRGRYIRGTGKAKATAFEKIYNICKRFDCDLERGCTFNALELTDAERSVYVEFCDCTLELRNYVREKAAEMAAILEKVHGVETGEASNVNLEAEAEIPEQSEPQEEAPFQTFEQDIESSDIPLVEQSEPELEEGDTEAVLEENEADGENHSAGKRGRRSKNK